MSWSLLRRLTHGRIEEYFSSICKYYLTSQTALITHRKRRNILNCEASFPFPDLRLGQHDMMREVTAAIRDKQVLFVNAPTGSGKTIAVLYPALKAQAHGLNDSIYYLTPSRSQRTVAEEALSLLREHGFLIRAITIRAKRSMCAQPKLFCDKTNALSLLHIMRDYMKPWESSHIKRICYRMTSLLSDEISALL